MKVIYTTRNKQMCNIKIKRDKNKWMEEGHQRMEVHL